MNLVRLGKVLCVAMSLLCLIVISGTARAASGPPVSEIWDLSASGHVHFDNSDLPNNVYGIGQDYDFDMGDGNINVSLMRNGNSWTVISANGFDSNGYLYELYGGNGLFSISGLGITPGFGPVNTDYTPTVYAMDSLSGNFSGSKIWNDFPGPNGLYSGTAEWSGTFDVSRTNTAPEPVSTILFLTGGTILVVRRLRRK